MKNLSPELEYKENSTCNYFTENVLSCNAALSSVMGREENVIQNNIQKEYTIDSCVLSPNICSASQKEIACSDQSVFTNHRCIISETVALSYLVSAGSVCGSRNEINARYLNPSSKLSTDTLHIGLIPCEKLCMSENNGGAETRRMVRSASLGHDLNSKEVGRNAGDSVVAVNSCKVSNSENATETESGNDEYVDASNPRCLKTGVRRGSLPSAMGKLENCSPCSLAAVLERIPLAYNPQTKQLHIISVTPSSTEVNSNSLHSTDGINSHNENGPNEPGNGHCRESPSKCLTTQEHLEDHLSHLPWKTGIGKPPYDKSESCSGYLSQDKVSVDLSRAPTYGSLQSKTDCCSSFSSISSLSTDFSISTTSPIEDPTNNDNVLKCSSSAALEHEDPGFIEINLDSQSIRSVDSSCPLNVEQYAVTTASGQGAKPKRLGLPGFLSRNLLSWKSREPGLSDAATGWKLFGKTPQQQAQDKVSVTSKSSDDSSEASRLSSDGCTTPRNRRNQDLVASSTTALILENRPSNLPAKLPEEEIKHRLEYEQMVEAAKKKEMKEAKQKKKLLQQQLRYEEQLCLASKIWNSEILPAWDTMKHSRKSKDLWWQGIPPSVRGKVWKLAIGNDLHITPELYEICVCRAKDRIRMAAESISISEYEMEVTDKEGSVELIKLDVSRTFPQLCIFQKGGPYYDMLHSLLGAYVCYRPDVGYVQGMSFLAAVLILNLDVADAFICFANVLNQPCQLAFFRLDEPMMRSYFLAYEEFFRENLPKLYNHFTRQNLTPDLYLIDWIYTIYSRSLPLDVASRVWDVYFRDGDEFLFRTALGILRLYQDILVNMDFIHLAQFLTKLPEAIAAEPLFKAIGYIRMAIEKRNFSQVLLAHVDTRQT